MKRKDKRRPRKSAVVPGMLFGLGAAMAPVLPACGVNATAADGGGGDLAIKDLVQRFPIDVMVPPQPPDFTRPFDLSEPDLAVPADMAVPDLRPPPRDEQFPIDVMVPRDLTIPVDLSAVIDGGGGDDGPGGDR